MERRVWCTGKEGYKDVVWEMGDGMGLIGKEGKGRYGGVGRYIKVVFDILYGKYYIKEGFIISGECLIYQVSV